MAVSHGAHAPQQREEDLSVKLDCFLEEKGGGGYGGGLNFLSIATLYTLCKSLKRVRSNNNSLALTKGVGSQCVSSQQATILIP